MPKPDTEFSGLLQRDASGFVLHSDDGTIYRLELFRTPVDEVGKRVVVTGVMIEDAHIEANGVRLI